MRIKAICIAMSVCTFSGYAQTDLQSGEQGLRSRQGFSETSAVEQERELAKTNEFLYDRKLKDDRPVVGVAAFKTDKESPYVGLVTEKIVEILKESGRFNVVDRTNRDKTLEVAVEAVWSPKWNTSQFHVIISDPTAEESKK